MEEEGKANQVNTESGGMTRRRFLARGAAFATAAAVTGPGLTILSGCGGGGSSSGPLSFWQFYAPDGPVEQQSRWFTDLVDSWNESQETQVELTYVPTEEYLSGQRLQTAFASGEGPDLFLTTGSRFLTFYNPGALLDLTPFMEQEAMADLFPEALNTRMVGDKIYGIPMELEPLAVFYSVRAFEEVGLSEGDIPRTWEQLLDVAQRLTTQDRFGLLFEPNANPYQNLNWYPFMWMAGSDVVSEDGSSSVFASDGTVQALQLWQDAVQSGIAPRQTLGTNASDLVANLAAGYCAMQETGIYSISPLEAELPDFEYGVFRLPLPPGGDYTTIADGWAFVANAEGKNPEEAGRFCAWAVGSMTEDSIRRGADWVTEAKSDFAPRQSVLELQTERGFFESGPKKTFRDDVFPGTRAASRYPPEIVKPITDAIQACMLDGADPVRRAERASQSIDSFLEGYSGAPIV